MSYLNRSIIDFVTKRNLEKKIFTAGPASLLAQNLLGVQPAFGRGDGAYLRMEEDVMQRLGTLSGHKNVVRLQGSASLALEIMSLNFLCGDVLVVSSGYYSDRMEMLAKHAKCFTKKIDKIYTCDWSEINDFNRSVDWIVACYVETSCGLKLPLDGLVDLKNRANARLMFDATASIGLEPNHDAADVVAYSSCKGLFGLTGACFVAFNDFPEISVDSFYLNINSHIEKKMTGPYHAICSLAEVLPIHDEVKLSVEKNKAKFLGMFPSDLSFTKELQPLLCTHVKKEITSDEPTAILYKPRSNFGGSVVCHLGEVHLGAKAEGKILDCLKWS